MSDQNDKLRRAGNGLSNIAFNLGQEAGPDLTPAIRSSLAQASREYDAALHEVLDAARATPAPQAAPSDFDVEGLRVELRRLSENTETYGHCEEAARIAFEGAIEALDEFAAAPAVAITPAPQSTASELPYRFEHDGKTHIWKGKRLIAVINASAFRSNEHEREEAGKIVASLNAASLTQAATSEPVHKLDAAMSLLRVALTVDAGKVSPAALRKQIMESVAIAEGADGEGEEYIYADVYGHLCELIEPYVLSDERPEGYPFTASVTDTMSMLIEYYQRAHLAGTTPNTEAPSVKTWQARVTGHAVSEYPSLMKAEIADLRAALSAQQAGVQEAPSEDAKDAAIAALKEALDVLDAFGNLSDGEISPRAWTCFHAEAKIKNARAALVAATQTEKK